jgi:hypothetical protein
VNPGGQHPKQREVRELARVYSVRALKELFKIGLTCSHWPSRVAALREVLDRAIGKAPVAVELAGPGGGPIPLSREVLATLTDDELLALRSVAAKIVEGSARPAPDLTTGRPPRLCAPSGAPAIDVDPVRVDAPEDDRPA